MRITESQLRKLVVEAMLGESSRPSDSEFREVLSYFRSNPNSWSIARQHFKAWAENPNAKVPGVNRELNYPGWTQGDFRAALRELG